MKFLLLNNLEYRCLTVTAYTYTMEAPNLEVCSMYQHGVPTNVFLVRCLPPESKRQAVTPKSPSLIPPRASTRALPAYMKQ